MAVCGAFLYVLGLLPVEEADGDWGCHGEVVSVAVVYFVDGCGFDFSDVVEEPVEVNEGVVVLDADVAVVNFRVESVFVEDGADFWLLHDEADEGVEVFDGFHCLFLFVFGQAFCLMCLI